MGWCIFTIKLFGKYYSILEKNLIPELMNLIHQNMIPEDLYISAIDF